MTEQEKTYREQALLVLEAIQKLIELPCDTRTWKGKSEILCEESEEFDDHSSLEEFLCWGEEFLPK